MIQIDSRAMIKRAEERDEKKRSLSSGEAAAVALAPLPVQILGSALAAGGSPADKSLARELVRMGRRSGIEFREYPKENLKERLWRLARGQFRTGEITQVPNIRWKNEQQKKVPYPGPDPKLTYGDVAGKTIVWKPSSAGMLSHEMGHLKERRLPKALAYAEQFAPLAGLGLGVIGAMEAKTPHQAARMGDIGAALAAGVQLPALAREAAASMRGLKYLRQAGATRGQLLRQGATRMLPAFLSAAAKASLLPLASIVASRLIAKEKTRKEGEK